MTRRSDRSALVQALRTDFFQSVSELARSGQLAEQAIRPLICSLQDDGLRIDQNAAGDFQLLDEVRPIDSDRLRQCLTARGFECSEQVEILDTVDSTSNWLHRQHEAGERIHGSACITEYQSAGRGRRGRQWRGSAYQHLMFSLGWGFQQSIETLSGLSLSLGVAIADQIKETVDVQASLKWPNDLWCNNRKLGGILVELISTSETEIRSIIGVGLNIREPHLSNLVADQGVTDLASEAQSAIPPREVIIADVFMAVVNRLTTFPLRGFISDRQRFNDLDVFKDRPVSAMSSNKEIIGTGLGADEHGRYCLRRSDGSVAHIDAAELSFSLRDNHAQRATPP